VVLSFIGIDQIDEDVKPVAARRSRLSSPQPLDLRQSEFVVPFCPYRFEFHLHRLVAFAIGSMPLRNTIAWAALA